MSPLPIPLEAWTFVAGTWDGKVARLYVDGSYVAEQPAAKPIGKNDNAFMIGAGTEGNRFFAGMIGQLRLYEGALAASEIEKLHEEGAGKYAAGPARATDTSKTVIVRSKVRPDREWKEYATRTLDLLEGYEKAAKPVELSAYGGWLGKRYGATGFFRAEQIDGRWWLIDPEGYRFIHVGVVSVNLGSSENMKRAFAEKFGDDKTWATETTRLLKDLNFNGTGGWSDHERLQLSGQPLPYVVRMNLMSGFGRKLGVTHAVPGHTGFELECIPVFHPDFAAYCREQAEVLADYRDDPYVVGIYSDNELQTPKLENYLKLDQANPAQRPNRQAAVAWPRERKGKEDVSAKDITMMDRLEFAGYAFERDFRIATEAIRKVDPNHLYIGSRFMSPNFQNPFIWKAAAPYCDVVAVNYYGCWGPRLDEVAYWQTLCPRPIMITEFYVKGEDSGLPNTSERRLGRAYPGGPGPVLSALRARPPPVAQLCRLALVQVPGQRPGREGRGTIEHRLEQGHRRHPLPAAPRVRRPHEGGQSGSLSAHGVFRQTLTQRGESIGMCRKHLAGLTAGPQTPQLGQPRAARELSQVADWLAGADGGKGGHADHHGIERRMEHPPLAAQQRRTGSQGLVLCDNVARTDVELEESAAFGANPPGLFDDDLVLRSSRLLLQHLEVGKHVS